MNIEVLVCRVECPRAACGASANGPSSGGRSTTTAAPVRPTAPLASLRSRCTAEPLNGRETRSLAFLVLLAPERFACIFVPGRQGMRALSYMGVWEQRVISPLTEELALRVDNLECVPASIGVVLKGHWSLRRHDNVDIFLLCPPLKIFSHVVTDE